MSIKRFKYLLPLMTVLLGYAQTGSPQTDAYRDRLRQENNRHAGVMTKLRNDRLDAAKQKTDEEIDCSAIKSQPQRKTCLDTATDNYAKAIRKIEKDENAENTMHAKNINNLERTMDEYCTRPDCVNSPRGQSPCTGASCK